MRPLSRRSRTVAEDGALQLGLIDERHPAEITHPDFPDERPVVCRNPARAAERAHLFPHAVL